MRKLKPIELRKALKECSALLEKLRQADDIEMCVSVDDQPTGDRCITFYSPERDFCVAVLNSPNFFGSHVIDQAKALIRKEGCHAKE